MRKRRIQHPIVVLKSIRSEKDVILQKGLLVDLDKVSGPLLTTLRNAWWNDPLSLGGDIVYLFNQGLPKSLSDDEKDTPSQS